MQHYFIPDRPIAFNRDFVKLGIGVKGALMLSQAVYWHKVQVKNGKDGEFYKSQSDWEEETGLTKEEQMSAMKKIQKYLKVEKKGLPARNHYALNLNTLGADLLSLVVGKANDQSWGKPTTGDGESPPHSTTETTTETTTYTKGEAKPSPDPKKPSISKEVAETIKEFESLDIQNKKFYGRKDMREACQTLLGHYGRDKVFATIRVLVQIRELREDQKLTEKLQYIPVVATPVQLLSKWQSVDKQIKAVQSTALKEQAKREEMMMAFM